MSSSPSRIEHLFYNAHSKVSHYLLRHTSHRLRSAAEHAVLGLAVCGFCVVILSHRTFVHREDVASIAGGAGTAVCDAREGQGRDSIGNIADGRGVSIYSLAVQLMRTGYAWMVSSKQSLSNSQNGTSSSGGKKIPGSCLMSIPGFREDADVNHILLNHNAGAGSNEERGRLDSTRRPSFGSRAFTINKGSHHHEWIVTGMPINSTLQGHPCVIGASNVSSKHRSSLFVFSKEEKVQFHQECHQQTTLFLAHHGYSHSSQSRIERKSQLPPIIYSYSHSRGFLLLQPSLQLKHNVSIQFIIASSTDPNCFGEPFAQNIIFRLVGPDTVILNWILGLQHAVARPRFLYNWNTNKELDLDLFDMDHYAFSSRSSRGRSNDANAIRSKYDLLSQFVPISRLVSSLQECSAMLGIYRFMRFLMFKFLVLLSTLLIFLFTTSVVSFTFQETQDRMLEFTLQLQTRVRARMPLGGLVLRHVLENLVFVPVMVGMIFFLIEFYGGDKFVAFCTLSLVWMCEVFSAISIRSAQGMHFFPRAFFLYFTLFHVYFFSCPIGFTYASLASTILFLFHTMIFFLNRYELPAVHAGLITPQSPRMVRLGVDRERGADVNRDMGGVDLNGNTGGVELNGPMATPSTTQPSLTSPPSVRQDQLPQMPLDDSSTAPTVPLSPTNDFTPQSEQHSLLPPSYSGPMRSYVAAASSSLLSIRSLASIQSSTSLVAERTNSPNFIFFGGNSFNDTEVVGDGEEDSYIARVMSSQ